MAPKPETSPASILSVDGDTTVGEALAQLFETAGYAIIRASDGERAWALISADADRFNVLITDHALPRLSGLELVQRVRALPFAGRIIVHSAKLGAEERRAYHTLVDALIVKPIEAEKLLGVVKAFHGESPSEQTP